jgi:hypothetical protein
VPSDDRHRTCLRNSACTSCGAIDLALLASALLTPDTRLWTMDKDLAELAARLGVVFEAEGIPPPA